MRIPVFVIQSSNKTPHFILAICEDKLMYLAFPVGILQLSFKQGIRKYFLTMREYFVTPFLRKLRM